MPWHTQGKLDCCDFHFNNINVCAVLILLVLFATMSKILNTHTMIKSKCAATGGKLTSVYSLFKLEPSGSNSSIYLCFVFDFTT